MGLHNNYNLTINRKDNKLLYFLDSGLDKFVMLVIKVVQCFVPGKYKAKFDKLAEHKDMLHNVLGLSFFNALGGLCVMATQVKLANYLGASVYGIYSYCLAIGEVGAMFVRYGRNKTMVRDLIQYPEKRDSLVVSTFVLSLINLGLFLLVTFACHKSLDIEVSWTYFLLILSPCLVSLSLGPVYESLKMMSWSAIYGLLQKFAFLAVIWSLFLFHYNVSLFAIGLIVVATWVAIGLMEYYEIGTQLRINFLGKVNIKELWGLYKDNFVIFLSCVTGVAFGPLIRLILNNYTDSKSVGIYAAGLQIYYICLFLDVQIARVGNPMMAMAGREDCGESRRRSLVFRYLVIKLAFTIPFAIVLITCPSLLVDLFFTLEYKPLIACLPILGLYMIFVSFSGVFEQYLISLRKDISYFAIYILISCLTVLMALFFIPNYGLIGAFIALCAPKAIGAISYFLASLKSLRFTTKP